MPRAPVVSTAFRLIAPLTVAVLVAAGCGGGGGGGGADARAEAGRDRPLPVDLPVAVSPDGDPAETTADASAEPDLAANDAPVVDVVAPAEVAPVPDAAPVPPVDAAPVDAAPVPPVDAAPVDVAVAPVDVAVPPVDAAPEAPAPVGCSVTPAANAANLQLAFRPVALDGMPGTGGGKPEGITQLHFVPGAPNEILLAHVDGLLSWWRLEAGADRGTFLRSYQVPGVFDESDCGLIAVAFDPGFVSNRVLYAGYCTSAKSSRVTRFVLTDGALTSPTTVLAFDEPDGSEPWHSIGSMGFDPAGNMWLFHGDFTAPENAQDPASTLGKLLRFRPRATGGVDPAPGNPYLGVAGKSPLVYALGLRSPWRGYLDSKGRFLVGDVGGTTAEELNLISRPGENLGYDGTRAGPCASCPGLTNPLRTYRVPNDPYLGQGNELYESREARAVWVGVQYQSCGNDRYGGAMTGVYLFGDLYTGWVRGAVIDDGGNMTTDRLLANVPALTSFAQGPDGYLYAAGIGNYESGLGAADPRGLYRVERAP